MKFLPGFLLVFFSMIFTGCFDILEDISLNKDGTGKYSLTFDMDQIIKDPFMKGMLLEMVKKEVGLEMDDTEKYVIDSIIYLKDYPEFAKIKASKVLLETAKMHMVVNEEKGKMFINFGFDFNEVGDIGSFFKSINENGESQALFSGLDQIVNGSNFVYKKKSLTRLPAVKGEKSVKDNFEGEELTMLKMFMTNSNLKTTYKFPGKVKKSSIENSVINNNEVTIATPLLDLLDGKAKLDGEIKFKN